MNFKKLALAFVLALLPRLALAQSTVLDQNPAPVPSVTNASHSELLTQSYAVPGGTLYIHTLRQERYNGGNGQPVAVAANFVPSSAGGLARYQALTNAKSDAGVALTASATSGAMGVSRSAGVNLDLVGEATSSNGKTDKALWELNVADSYVPGQAIPIVVNANYTGSGTVTAASTTLTVNAYTEAGGVETAISGITAAQQFSGTATNYTFTIPGAAGLTPGSHIVVEIVMLVTTSAGALTGQINSLALTM